MDYALCDAKMLFGVFFGIFIRARTREASWSAALPSRVVVHNSQPAEDPLGFATDLVEDLDSSIVDEAGRLLQAAEQTGSGSEAEPKHGA